MSGSSPAARWIVIAILALPVFLGTLTQLSDHFLGMEYVDAYGTQWFYWFTGHALGQGQGFGHTDLYFYPYGKDIFRHTGANVLDAIVAIPFRALLGPVLGYNAFVIAGLVGSGVAFARLARDHTEDRLAIWMAAGFATLSPFVLTEIAEGRPTQAFLALPALYLRELLRCARPGWRAPVLGGVFLALTGYQYWYYAFFGGLVGLAHGLTVAASPPDDAGGRLGVLTRHAAMALVAGLLVAPVAIPLVLESQQGVVPGLINTSTWTWSSLTTETVEGESVGLFLWQPWLSRSGFLASGAIGSAEFLRQGDLSPTVAVMFAVLYLFRPGALRRGPVVAMFLTVLIVSCGPILIIGDAWIPNPPYRLLMGSLSFVRRLWWPARAYAFASLLLALSAAVALAWIGTRSRAAQLAAALVGALGWSAHLMHDRLAPMATWDATVPAGYQCLGKAPEGAILELPFAWTQAHLYYQTVHQHPILGGMLEANEVFAPPEAVALREDNSFVAALIQLTRSEGDERPQWTEQDRAALHDLGYRYVVLQRDAFALARPAPGLADNAIKARLRRMRTLLADMLGPPVYEDARINLYAPWGDPVCGADAVTPDTETLGNSEVVHGLRIPSAPGETRIRPLLGGT